MGGEARRPSEESRQDGEPLAGHVAHGVASAEPLEEASGHTGSPKLGADMSGLF